MLHIRPVEINDISSIQFVAKETWFATYGNIYSTEFIEGFLNKAYSNISLERSILNDQKQEERKFLVALDEDFNIIGYVHLRNEADGVYELLRIYVLPQHQGKGIGNKLLIEIKNRIKTLHKLKAWVESDNQIGRRFYDCKGFKAINEKYETVEGFTTKLLCYEFDYK